jgi:SP family sugar:H+ symporter-like MFS transporter
MGALIAGRVADRIGRKWSICAWCLMLHVGLIVQMTAANHKWYQSKFILSPPETRINLCSCRWKMDCRPRRWSTLFIGTYGRSYFAFDFTTL